MVKKVKNNEDVIDLENNDLVLENDDDLKENEEINKNINKKLEKIDNEKKQKEDSRKIRFLGKDLYIIENGIISKIDPKDLKENDYILKYDQEKEFYIIDRDKRKIRPFVEDLLNTMGIETLQMKLIKASLVFTVILICICIMSFFISMSGSGKAGKVLDILNKVEKIQFKCDKPTLIPNNTPDVMK